MSPILLAAFTLLVAASAREEVTFSRAWRWHYGPGGDDAGPGPGNSWAAAFAPIASCDAAGVYPDPHRMSSSDCATSCAYDSVCVAWVHDPAGRACSHANAGVNCVPAATNATTIGGLRAAPTPLQTAYSYAAATLPEAAAWPLVDAPHDALFSLNGSFSESGGDQRHGYRVRTVVWYRKSFALPAEWAPANGGATTVRFEGIIHFAQLWLNGIYLGHHASGYGEFTVRLDNVSGAVFGGDNVLAVRADASYGSEHWFGGGGITRPVQLVHVGALSFVEHGVFVPAELPVGSTTASASAEFQNYGGASASATVRFDVFDASGALVVTATSPAATPPANGGGTVVASAPLALPADVALWTTTSPTLFRVCATLLGAAGSSEDSVNVTVGFKRVEWNANTGFLLNGENFRLRGFSHHNSFAGVGVAMPPRLDLFRAQVARAAGSNVWRMSHNPYRNSLYDMLDATGVAVWDENRDMGPSYAYQMGEMVKRGRNHPSIIVNSLCNEVECTNLPEVGKTMVALSRALDPTKKTTANSNGNDGLWADIDVQGYSHAPNGRFVAAHADHPSQPLVLSECCSCTTQRMPRETSDSCMIEQNAPLALPFVAGSLGVWTLFDYMGEPPGAWPFVSSSFGQLDFAGFPKPHAYWYTTNWRELPAAGKPFTAPAPTAHILDLPAAQSSAGFVAAITSAPSAELFVDGVSLGVRPSDGSVMSWALATPPVAAGSNCSYPVDMSGVQCHGLRALASGNASAAACAAAACHEFAHVWQFDATQGCWAGKTTDNPCPPPNKPGTHWVGGGRGSPSASFRNATLVARDAGGAVVATHSVRSPTAAPVLALTLTLDVPSATTGTGARVLLDGLDCALLRVSLVDSTNGALVVDADVNVTFTVISGPARFAGVGNGDPTSHDQPNGATLPTFGGLARGIVIASVDCVGADRDRARAVDVDGASGPTTVLPAGAPCPTSDIVVAVDAPGLARTTIAIPVSGDADADGVLAAARAAMATGAIAYVDAFNG